jgi:hypothetical protein
MRVVRAMMLCEDENHRGIYRETSLARSAVVFAFWFESEYLNEIVDGVYGTDGSSVWFMEAIHDGNVTWYLKNAVTEMWLARTVVKTLEIWVAESLLG